MYLKDYLNLEFNLHQKDNNEYIFYGGLKGEILSLKENEIISLYEENDQEFIKALKSNKLQEVSISSLKDYVLEFEFIFDYEKNNPLRIKTLTLCTAYFERDSFIKKLYSLLENFPPKPDMFLNLPARMK